MTSYEPKAGDRVHRTCKNCLASFWWVYGILLKEPDELCRSCESGEAPPAIDNFRGFYRFLSNFHCAPVEYEGLVYPSTEHAYQAAKTTDVNLRKGFIALTCPAAKKLGQGVPMREDWEQVKRQVMYEVVRQKFTRHLDLGKRLVATGTSALIEGNDWHDNFWGTCRCVGCGDKGQNHLGRILMEVRSELREKGKTREAGR